MLTRRLFLGGLISAPAIVAVRNIMPIKSLLMPFVWNGEPLYVNGDLGDDANNGIDPAKAFRTLQKALDTIGIVENGNDVTIHCAAGVYDAPDRPFIVRNRGVLNILGSPIISLTSQTNPLFHITHNSILDAGSMKWQSEPNTKPKADTSAKATPSPNSPNTYVLQQRTVTPLGTFARRTTTPSWAKASWQSARCLKRPVRT